ncbi:MAG TPA: MFS transporter [Anaerolineales bacterium]|nr:MFS transporter [Anaerolineales bacterium]
MLIRVPPAIHHRRFRLLWISLMISIAGTQMQTWALFWHIRTLTDQPIALGGVGLARILPIFLFSLLGGAVADAANRRKLLFATQFLLVLVASVLAWLTFRGELVLWHIYLLTALQAMAASFDTPARQAMVPNLVPARDLASAFSLTSIGHQTGAIVGPALSGLVIAYLGQPYAYMINAVSYLAVFGALLLIGPVEQQADPGRRNAVDLHAIREGIRFIVSHPIILSTMILDFFATFFSSANTLMPIIARDILGVGAIEYGWLSSAQAIGALIAAGIVSQFGQIRRQGTVFLGAVVAFGLATVVFGLVRTYSLALVALMLIGASDSVSTIIRNTIRQLQTPDYIRGRMVSINQIFFMGGPQLGEVEAGLVAQFFSAPVAIVSGGVGCLLAVAWIARRWPLLRAYNGDEPLLAVALAD